eukprot:6289204-Prymnesium_polylepis.1
MSAPIKGRLPHGWRIEARFAANMLKITSPDTDNFLIYVETNKMHEYSAEYEKTWAKLDKDYYVDAKYDDESGVLRFDSHTYPEFWIEVTVNKLPEVARKKQKTSTSDDDRKQEQDEEDYETMPWSKIEVEEGVLTLWPGTPVREADLYGPKSLHYFFQKAFDIEVTPVGCVKTLPDVEDGQEVEGTGGRIDFFFFVKTTDVFKFAIKRFAFGMRWWEDIDFNNGEDIYPLEFISESR